MFRRVAVIAATIAAVAGLGIAGVNAAPAAGSKIIDGNGTDLPILITAHGDPALTDNAGGGSVFTKVAVGGNFELEGPNGLCLTVNTSVDNEVYSESCSGAASTLWEDQAGGLLTSILLADEGVTGHMTANTGFSCTTPAGLIAQGGVAAGNCHIVWSGA